MQDGALTTQPLRHSISEASASNYVGVNIPVVFVDKVDNDAAGVIVTQSGDDTVVFEGGATDTISVGLSHAPAAGQSVTVTLTSDGQIKFNGSTSLILTFTGAAAQTVTLSAVDDSTIEGFLTSSMSFAVAASDPAFNGVSVPDLDVLVADNEIGGVLIRESGGSTNVIEADGSHPEMGSSPFIDSYTVVLTKAPSAPVTIHIVPQLTNTGGTRNQTFTAPAPGPQTFTLGSVPRGGLVTRVLIDGNRLDRNQFSVSGNLLTVNASVRLNAVVQVTYQIESNQKQVVVSTTAGGSYTDGLDLTFDSSNWNVARTVWVKAIDDTIIDGDGVQATAAQARSLGGIRGPLSIFGGNDPNANTTIPPPVMYIGETDPHEFVPDPNSNFSVQEPEQVDVLSALNTDNLGDALGTLTDTRLTGFGMGPDRIIGGNTYGGGITYSDVELLRVDLGHGNDRLRVASTHGGVTILNGGPGNDQINIQTIGGPTLANGLGTPALSGTETDNDRFDIGSNFGDSWFGAAINHSATPPNGVLDQIRALLRIDGGPGIDTIDVDDSGDATQDVGILTGTTLSGLNLVTSPVQTVALTNAVDGTFRLRIGTNYTVALPYLAGSIQVKAAIMALKAAGLLPHVTDVLVNRAGDTFTIGFLGDEQMNPAALTITGDASALSSNSGTPASIPVTAGSQGRTQTLDVHSTGGSYTITVGTGSSARPFTFNYGMTADAFRDALIAAIRSMPNAPLAADGPAVGVKDVFVDKLDSSYVVTYLGLLRSTTGDAFGLYVAPNSLLPAVQTGGTVDLTINAVGGTFTLSGGPANSAGALRTWALGYNATDAQIELALQTLMGPAVHVATISLNAVTGNHVLRFTGLSATLAIDDRNLDNPLNVGNRREGVNYYGLANNEWLNIDLGSASDVFNARGTTAITNVYAHGGDDRFYVSELANETIASAFGIGMPKTDFLEGNLDFIRGNLNVDAGAGRHLLFISDEAATVGDPNVVITDHPTTSTRVNGAEIEIRGLAPASIDYLAAAGTAGNFADGITMWSGYGNDGVTIDGTHERNVPAPGGGTLRTITTLNTGLGDDTVTATLTAGQDGFFVLNTQGPYNEFWSYTDADKVYGQTSTLPLIVFGGQGNDLIVGGQGDDLLFGDRGRVLYFTDPSAIPLISYTITDAQLLGLESTAVSVLGHGGHLDKTDGVVRPIGLAISVDRLIGGIDTIYGNGGQDVAIGGAAGDFMDGGNDRDLLFGDNAAVQRRIVGDLTNPRFRTVAGALYSSATATAGNVLVGAAFQSDPSGTPRWNDFQIMLLDHDLATQTAGLNNFGSDYIAGGPDNDVIFGELGNDTIQGDSAVPHDATTWFVTQALFVNAYRGTAANRADWLNPSLDLTVVPSVDNWVTDGDDYVEGGGGNDLIFGNLGQDDLIGGSSSLFNLLSPSRRPDGADLIFGGSGNRIDRNDVGGGRVGDVSANIHSRDSDTIMGDNANVYRAVTGGGTNAYRAFNYDNYAGATLHIVPRAAELIDYTAGGPDITNKTPATISDIGTGDELHGESGDDFMYGMTGNDVMFGEGQDDDMVGGWGNDWMSGGTGDDGVVGSDGRIYTSRNGLTEPLNGLTTANVVNQQITTPGNMQQATIYVANLLNKSVDLSPFNYDPNTAGQNELFIPLFDDDILFGGLGNDFLHGGPGDDAISGAEALPLAYTQVEDATTHVLGGLTRSDYARPFNPGNALRYNPDDLDAKKADRTRRAGEFALYDEYDPLRKIMLDAGGNLDKTASPTREFFLNFSSTEGQAFNDPTYGTAFSDGSDVLFGDLGNDMLFGGTGRDDMYGGWGNDYLQADDVLSTHGNLNDQPETHPTYEDRAYGGAGRDVMIANTGGDRLIDWVGEFNTYLVPFAPFGMATVSRTLQPQLAEFLYALSKADGADFTRAADTGADVTRNGEPEGELGVIRQQDFAWHDQTGAPSDPQAGNIPGGKRDVLRTANFNDNQFDGFFVDSGSWTASAGILSVSAASLGKDAASVFALPDYLPVFFEVQASISVTKPTAGWKANAYIIFDYQSATAFKFTGIDVSTNKLVMGHRDATGWIVDKQTPFQAKSDTFYNMLLSVNGLTATLVVNNSAAFSQTYQARVVDGYSYGLNYGFVGFGSDDSRGNFDNLQVQVLPPQINFDSTENFTGATPGLYTGASSGTWQVSGGRFIGTPATGGIAYRDVDLGLGHGLSANSYLELTGTLSTTGTAGFIFDQYAANDYKFAVIDVRSGKASIGHVDPRRGLIIETTVARSLLAGTDYTLVVTLKGTTASLTVNGQIAVSWAYNAPVVDGAFGLYAQSGNVSADSTRTRANDAAFGAPSGAMTVDPQGAVASGSPAQISTSDLPAAIADAKTFWTAELGPTDPRLASLDQVTVALADLDGMIVGHTDGTVVLLDPTAAGFGWYLSGSPALDGGVDLLTVVRHEFGHAIGFEHDDAGAHSIMGDTIRLLLPGTTQPNTITPSSGDRTISALSGGTGNRTTITSAPSPSISSTRRDAITGPSERTCLARARHGHGPSLARMACGPP